MDNQHRKITKYRELTQEEVDLMNEIKAKEAEIEQLQLKIEAHVQRQAYYANNSEVDHPDHEAVRDRHAEAKPFTWLADSELTMKKAFMSLVRAVAQPAG